jgi:cysteinyl-tRNA synthetase
MVLASYGCGVDVHGGGADLAYPHHACEAGLVEAATGVKPFARTWLRAGVVQAQGQKMAKSAGNLVLVDDLLRDHTPAVLRLLCLGRPRREPWSYLPELMDRAAAQLDELYSAAAKPGAVSAVEAVADALLGDLNIPAALQIASESGGPAARALIDVLALS